MSAVTPGAMGSALAGPIGTPRRASFRDWVAVWGSVLGAFMAILDIQITNSYGITEVAAIGAVAVNKLPLVAMTLREGARSLSRDLTEMAQAFRLGRWRRLRHVVVPQLVPYFLVAARSGLSLIWKIVLVVELLGRSDGVGFKLQLFFQLFDVPHILAYAIAFAAIVQLIEWGILQPLERWAGAWRR